MKGTPNLYLLSEVLSTGGHSVHGTGTGLGMCITQEYNIK